MARTDHRRGASASVQTVYDLSKVWYADRMDRDWKPPTPAQAEQVFARFDLTGEFWTLA